MGTGQSQHHKRTGPQRYEDAPVATECDVENQLLWREELADVAIRGGPCSRRGAERSRVDRVRRARDRGGHIFALPKSSRSSARFHIKLVVVVDGVVLSTFMIAFPASFRYATRLGFRRRVGLRQVEDMPYSMCSALASRSLWRYE